jgi:NTE family protein
MAKRKPRIGIALGAGSARGWAHIGVLQALRKSGVEPDIVCGTSIGSLVGAVHAGDRLDELEQWVGSLTWRKVVSYFDLAFSSGLLKGGRLFTFLRGDFLNKDIERLSRPFAAVATDLESGREVWLRSGPVADAVRASIATPGLFTPWLCEDRLLVDGALVNPVPVSLARAMGADFVIAVDLSSSLIGRYGNSGTGDSAPKGPSMVEIMTASLNIMGVRITRSRLAGEPADAIVQPRLGQVGLLEYHRGAESMAEGRAAAELAYPHIRRALQDFW